MTDLCVPPSSGAALLWWEVVMTLSPLLPADSDSGMGCWIDDIRQWQCWHHDITSLFYSSNM